MTTTEQVEALFARYVEQHVRNGIEPDLAEICADDPERIEPLAELVAEYQALADLLAQPDAPSRVRAVLEARGVPVEDADLDEGGSSGSGTGSGPTRIAAGAKLSHYRLQEKIGEGGMGAVWRAEDTILGRTVAIKVLPTERVLDEDRRRMFLAEAQLASSVSHAHIVQVYEFAQEGDLDYLVMELVEGRPLHHILDGRPRPPAEVTEWGRQLAAALARAHHEGLLHRDLKPANILITDQGEVKIVDFGLATLFQSRHTNLLSSLSLRAEETTHEQQLAIVGTVPYMSPEQIRGEELDSRSDTFSLGVVLYEMTTGRRPFEGHNFSEIASAIQAARPTDIHQLVPGVPLELERIVRKAMAARPRDRYQTLDDLAVDLKRLERDLEAGSSPSYSTLSGRATRALSRKTVAWVGGGVLVAAGLVAGTLALAGVFRPPSPEATDPPSAPPIHRQLTFTGHSSDPEISPDEQFIVYREPPARLLLRDLQGGEPLEILSGSRQIVDSRWAPDGTALLVRLAPVQHLLVPRLGGSPRTLDVDPEKSHLRWAGARDRLVAWLPAEKWLKILDVASLDGEIHLLEGDWTWLMDVAWSPRGDRLALRTASKDGGKIWTAPADRPSALELVWTGDPSSRDWGLRWSGDGRSLYVQRQHRRDLLAPPELLKLTLDPETGRVEAPPAVLMNGITVDSISPSRSGRLLVHSRSVHSANLWTVQVEADGTKVPGTKRQLTRGTGLELLYGWRISPDGRRVVFVRHGDLVILPTNGGTARRLTFSPGVEMQPCWSPDGRSVAYLGFADGTPAQDSFRLWRIPATGERRPLVDEEFGYVFSPLLSPDGRRVVLSWHRSLERGPEVGRADGTGLWEIALNDGSERRLVPEVLDPYGWSDDGRWILGWSNKRRSAVRVFAKDGSLEVLFFWPFEGSDGICRPAAGGPTWVCAVYDGQEDVWLTENFDPEVPGDG